MAGAKSACVTRGWAIWVARRRRNLCEEARRWEAVAGGIGGRAHLHGVADEARRSIPAQCMGLLCTPGDQTRCACACGEGSRENWRGVRRAQQLGCGARSRVAQQARSRRALCRGQGGRSAYWRGRDFADLRSADALNEEISEDREFKASADLKSPSPGAARTGVLPSCPRHSARLLRACCTNLLRSATCLMPCAHLASFPELPSPHARTAPRLPAGMQSKPMHWAGMLLRASSATP